MNKLKRLNRNPLYLFKITLVKWSDLKQRL